MLIMHIKLRPSNQTRKSQEGLVAVFPSLASETIKYLIIILLFIFLGSFLALNTSLIPITNQITRTTPKSLWSAWWNVFCIYMIKFKVQILMRAIGLGLTFSTNYYIYNF